MPESKWLTPIWHILTSDSDDLVSLAKACGADPTIFYVGQDLSKCDVRGQDLRGLNLDNTNIAFARMDAGTKLDEKYDPRLPMPAYSQIVIREEVYALALAFAEKVNYVYKAWAIKALLETGSYILASDPESIELKATIPNLFDYLDLKKGRTRKITVRVFGFIVHAANYWVGQHPERINSAYNRMIFLAILQSHVMPDLKNITEYSPLELLPRSKFYLDGIRKGRRFVS